MKLRETRIHTQTLNSQKEFTYSVKEEDMGLVFETMRSRIYSNPIGAICREISCNARDANRESGNGKKPIQIIITEVNAMLSASDPTITFKDEGPGISPNRMGNVFCNYMASTKRDSNEFTGAYGLGSKTPFSYTDSFVIQTVVEEQGKRVKYFYTAYIDKSKKGKIELFNQEETVESTGTEIIVGIKKGDRYTFEEECVKSTYFWDIRPELIGFGSSSNLKSEKDTVIHQTADYQLRAGDFYGASFVAVIDGVAYSINRNLIPGLNLTISNHILAFFFKIGELDISAPREELQYEERTIRLISKKLEVAKVELTNLVKKYLDDAPTYLEACIRMNLLKGRGHQQGLASEEDLFKALYEWKQVEFKDYKYNNLSPAETLDPHTFEIFKLQKDTSHPQFVSTSKINGSYLNKLFLNHPVLWLDTDRRSAKKNKTLVDQYSHFFLIVLKKFDYDFITDPVERQKQFDDVQKKHQEEREVLQQLLAPGKYSEVSETKLERVYTKPVVVKISCRRASSSTDLQDWKSAILFYDLETKILKIHATNGNDIPQMIYFTVNKLTDIYKDESKISFDTTLKALIAAHYLKLPLYCVAERSIKHLTGHLTVEQALKQIPGQTLQELADLRYIQSVKSQISELYRHLDFESEIGDVLKKILKTKIDVKSHFNSSNVSEQLLEGLGYPMSSELQKTKDINKEIEKKYPLLRAINNYYNLNTEQIRHANLYIKAIDENESNLLNQIPVQSLQTQP